MKLAWLASFALAGAALPPQLRTASGAELPPRVAVDVEELEGETWCSIRAERARVAEVVQELARRTSRAVEGLELVSPTAIVSVDLRHRPLHQALTYVLGTVGLRAESRAGVLALRASPRMPAPVETLRSQALAAYLAALRAFPEHAEAAGALHAQARLEEQRGHLAAAQADYDQLVERFPQSALVPEALLRSGELLALRGEWEQASQRLMDLLRLELDHPFEVPARLALARCTAHLDQPQLALDMLDALDSANAPLDLADLQRRRAVRARALVAAGRPREALEHLDLLDGGSHSDALRREALELRAQALEGCGEPAGAARAWIALSAEVEGMQRTIALRHAARLALAAQDELAVLMIRGLAGADGRELEPLAREARARLELADAMREAATPEQRLARAEALLAEGRHAQAHEQLASLLPLREALSQPALARHALAYARTLDHRAGADAALAFLREALPALADAEQRRALYVLAGDLLERDGRLDEAALAYQGRL